MSAKERILRSKLRGNIFLVGKVEVNAKCVFIDRVMFTPQIKHGVTLRREVKISPISELSHKRFTQHLKRLNDGSKSIAIIVSITL